MTTPPPIPRTSTGPVASLILSVLGVLTFALAGDLPYWLGGLLAGVTPLLSIAAVVVGSVARHRGTANNGLATAGIALGALTLAIYVPAVVLALTA